SATSSHFDRLPSVRVNLRCLFLVARGFARASHASSAAIASPSPAGTRLRAPASHSRANARSQQSPPSSRACTPTTPKPARLRPPPASALQSRPSACVACSSLAPRACASVPAMPTPTWLQLPPA
ncbi:Unknown protein, partial [Striga hermonthica]